MVGLGAFPEGLVCNELVLYVASGSGHGGKTVGGRTWGVTRGGAMGGGTVKGRVVCGAVWAEEGEKIRLRGGCGVASTLAVPQCRLGGGVGSHGMR